jgi:16S rRNA (adenine1518-N6/adenine1519-N6)-dimethyltransferase
VNRATVDELDPTRLGPEALARYLRRHGLEARKKHSQNFLVDPDVLETIVEAAAPAPGRRILEIGPGLGVLTGALLRAGARVVAVEVDPRMNAHLRGRHEADLELAAGDPDAPGGLTLVEADILDTPIEDVIGPPYDLVANLPYHITSPVLHHALGEGPRPERLVLMLQREVAERIASPPGGMSYLSVFVQYHANVHVARIVPPEAFEPAPAVESAVLVGETRPRRLDESREDDLWRLVQAGFRERRKMVHNVLSRQLPAVGRDRISAALAEVGISPDRRPQTIGVDEWLELADVLGPLP